MSRQPAAPAGSDPSAPTKSLADVEMEYILQVYAKNGMNKQKASDELGISLKTLHNKLHKYEEERHAGRGERRRSAAARHRKAMNSQKRLIPRRLL